MGEILTHAFLPNYFTNVTLMENDQPLNPMSAPQKILIIDDDKELTALIGQFLDKNGFQVSALHSGDNALTRIQEADPDLIILDLMLPDTDGLTICKEVRPYFSGPIIMLTALNDDIDEVTGLEVGADDYLAKPVKPRVLLAHIRAQLRRQSSLVSSEQPLTTVVSNGSVVIDERTREVQHNGERVILSNAEYELLLVLAHSAGTIISRDELHQAIFRLEFDGYERSIDIRISRLRKKFGDDPKDPQLIKTIRNKGYLIAN